MLEAPGRWKTTLKVINALEALISRATEQWTRVASSFMRYVNIK
jgi:hypothetical protein